jgi:hypothetical protein
MRPGSGETVLILDQPNEVDIVKHVLHKSEDVSTQLQNAMNRPENPRAMPQAPVGHMERDLSGAETAELQELLEEYISGNVFLRVISTLQGRRQRAGRMAKNISDILAYEHQNDPY